MKITKRQLKRLIRETSDLTKFQFSLNPQVYLSRELDFEQLRTIIELILDADGIAYLVQPLAAHTGGQVMYKFGKNIGKPVSEEEALRSYQAFKALIDALQKAGIPTEQDIRDYLNVRHLPSYRSDEYTIPWNLGGVIYLYPIEYWKHPAYKRYY